jgi:RNA polymerase sigma-70 factor (ECF subfamily)
VYLVFNEGYAATEGEPFRDDLAQEAIQLATLVAELVPDDPEAHALRALILLQHSRRGARIGDDGELVTMEEQDRSRWDRSLIADGMASLATARALGGERGYYALQAEIAALHVAAATPEVTDWTTVTGMYDDLFALHPSPVIAINRAVAIGFRDGPDAGLSAVGELGASAIDDAVLPSVRADFHRRAGRTTEAAAAYREAIGRARTDAERRQLERRLAEL